MQNILLSTAFFQYITLARAVPGKVYSESRSATGSAGDPDVGIVMPDNVHYVCKADADPRFPLCKEGFKNMTECFIIHPLPGV